MDDIVVIALFRHGLTEANKRQAYLGWTDSPLCQNVERASEKYDYHFSSDLGRCLETANRMFPNDKAHTMEELREMNFGGWEGKTYEELEDDSEYQLWLSDSFSKKPPEGESFDEFSERVDLGWSKVTDMIINLSLNKTAIVTHGGVIRAILSKWAPMEKGFWEWEVPHGKGYELIWNREDLRRGERCTLLREAPLMANLSG